MVRFFCLFVLVVTSWAFAVPNVSINPPVISNGSTPVKFQYLNDSGTNIPSITFVAWTWGDGSSNYGPPQLTNIIHFFENLGVYQVKLEVYADGLPYASNTFTVYVTNWTPGTTWIKVAENSGIRHLMGGAWFVTPGGIKGLTGVYSITNNFIVASNLTGSLTGEQFSSLNEDFPIRHVGLPAYSYELGKYWLVGGLNMSNGFRNNEIFASTDATTWNWVTNAPWIGREGHGFASLGNRLFVVGGLLNDSIPTNDVWSSFDGVNWTLVLSNAPFSPRGHFTLNRFNNHLVLIGGVESINPSQSNAEVWISPNGSNWSLATNFAAFGNRHMHKTIVYQNNLLLLGGISDSGPKRDIWVTRDMTNWGPITQKAPWIPRSQFSILLQNNRLILIGGHQNSAQNNPPYIDDVWVAPLFQNNPIQSSFALEPSRWRLSGLPVSQTVSNVPLFFSNVMPPELWAWEPRMTSNLNLGTKYVRPLALAAGRGFWMLADVSLPMKATSTPPTGPVFVPLVGGEWNLVANPYAMRIDRSALRLSPDNAAVPVQTFPLLTNILDPESLYIYSAAGPAQYCRVGPSESIPMGAGFWIWAHSNCILAFNPVTTTNNPPAAYFGLAAAPMASGADMKAVRLKLTAGNQMDTLTEVETSDAGVCRVSSRPPTMGSMAAVIPSAAPAQGAQRITRIPLTIQGPAGVRSANLSWDLAGMGRQRYFLRDLATGTSTELRSGASLEIALSAMGNARRMELVVTADGNADKANAPLALSSVLAYPNPAIRGRPVTFRYSVDRDATLTLEIRDASGRLVFRDSRRDGGFAGSQLEWVWNGNASSGNTPPAGIYHYTLSATGASGESAASTGKISLETSR